MKNLHYRLLFIGGLLFLTGISVWCIAPSAQPSEAVKLLLDVQGTDFIVTGNGKAEGILTRSIIIKTLSERGDNTRIRDVMIQKILPLRLDTPLDKAYKEMKKVETTIFPVIEKDNLAGVIDTENILEFILIQEAKKEYDSKNNPPVDSKLIST